MKIKLRLSEFANLHAALRSFDDGFTTLVKSAGGEKAEKIAYAFNAKTRFAIAKNINTIAASREAVNDARNKLIRQLAKGGLEVPKEHIPQFNDQLNELLETVEEMDMEPIDYDELKADDNRIPPSVIAALMPILSAE